MMDLNNSVMWLQNGDDHHILRLSHPSVGSIELDLGRDGMDGDGFILLSKILAALGDEWAKSAGKPLKVQHVDLNPHRTD